MCVCKHSGNSIFCSTASYTSLICALWTGEGICKCAHKYKMNKGFKYMVHLCHKANQIKNLFINLLRLPPGLSQVSVVGGERRGGFSLVKSFAPNWYLCCSLPAAMVVALNAQCQPWKRPITPKILSRLKWQKL